VVAVLDITIKTTILLEIRVEKVETQLEKSMLRMVVLVAEALHKMAEIVPIHLDLVMLHLRLVVMDLRFWVHIMVVVVVEVYHLRRVIMQILEQEALEVEVMEQIAQILLEEME